MENFIAAVQIRRCPRFEVATIPTGLGKTRELITEYQLAQKKVLLFTHPALITQFVKQIGDQGIAVFKMSSAMSLAERTNQVEQFEASEHAVLVVSRMLTHGWRVSKADLVVFDEPRIKTQHDEAMLLQALGRVNFECSPNVLTINPQL